jgi:hypothetical protein
MESPGIIFLPPKEKAPIMQRILAIAVAVVFALALGGCGGPADPKTPSTDTTTMGPAPDNNSATNPSLADTGYEKNRTRPITDTMKKK